MGSTGDTRPGVLFLCTGNSARSILAEAILTREAGGRLAAHSAGSHPVGRVNPYALALLAERGHETVGFASKNRDRFAEADAPRIDAVITVCDAAAGETCPIWPGNPSRAHWGLPDPAAETDPDAARLAFARTYDALSQRIGALLARLGDGGDAAALRAALAAESAA